MPKFFLCSAGDERRSVLIFSDFFRQFRQVLTLVNFNNLLLAPVGDVI